MHLVDGFGRRVDYLRLSVTDRCNFRCVYCMAEEMTFAPKNEVLSLEEIHRLASIFVSLGVKKIRLTGGEPLVRHNFIWLVRRLGALPRVTQLAITTNGALLRKHVTALKEAGVSRLNISLDSLDDATFTHLTRFGKIAEVLDGLAAAKETGFSIRLNSVILKGINDHETLALVDFARANGCDIAFIEEMPLGGLARDRAGESIRNDTLYTQINAHYRLSPLDYTSGGPARYYRLPDDSIRVGFISPHSHNFCSSCNRVRLTASGRLLLCLGNEHSLDLREPLRTGASDQQLRECIIDALRLKPERHTFNHSEEPQILRFMNSTGG